LALGDSDFFLQVHGQQPKGTLAAKFWDRLVKEKRGGYNKKKRNAILKKNDHARLQMAA